MKSSRHNKVVGFVIFAAIATAVAIPAISQKIIAAQGKVSQSPLTIPVTLSPANLSESSRHLQSVSQFLNNPMLVGVLTKAKNDKQLGLKATQNAKMFLSDNGIQVPMDIMVELRPSNQAGSGQALKIRIGLSAECCDPPTIKLTLTF